MTKKLKSGTPFVYDENDRVVGIRDPHTGTDTDLVTAIRGPGGGVEFSEEVANAIAALGAIGPNDASAINFQQAGTGAIVRTAQDKLREVVSVEDFGAVGDGVADDTAQIQACIDAAAAAGVQCCGAGIYRISEKIVIKGDADFSRATFRVYGSPAVAVEISTGNAADPVSSLVDVTVKLGTVDNMAKAYGGGWAGQGVGVRAVNLVSCDVSFRHIRNFAVGFHATAFGAAGFAYNSVRVGYLENNQVNLLLRPGVSTAYVNENIWYGGRYHFRSEEGSEVATTRQLQILPADTTTTGGASWPNNNVFLKPSLEGSVPEFQAEIGGNNNIIIGGRWETFSGVLPKVRFTGHPSNTTLCAENQILGGYDAERIVFSTTGVGLWGDISHPRKKTHSGFGINQAMRNTGGDLSGTPLMRGYKSDKDLNAATSSDTDWQMNIYARGLAGKASTDAHPRIDMAWWEGRMYFGTGAAAPTKYISGAGSFLNCSIDFVPAADNVYALGSGSSRWSQLYAASAAINTSDEREKQQVMPIDAAALRAWGRVEYFQFRFNDAVEKKGDGARWHVGVIAQRVKEAFEAEGLDPFAYGILCYDEWPEQPEILNEDGAVVEPYRPAGNRYGIRYEEALALECAYLRSRLP